MKRSAEGDSASSGASVVTKPLPDIVTECALDVVPTDGTCSTRETIADLARAHKLPPTVRPAVVIQTAKKEMGCDTELCVIQKAQRSDMSGASESEKRLKKRGPSNNTALLHNDNIDGVLSSLVTVHKKLYHMPFQMIDFAGEKNARGTGTGGGTGGADGDDWRIVDGTKMTPTELGTIDMVRDVIDKGYSSFCVVMNTDTRNGGGIHWFPLYCDFTTQPFTIEYFTSSGNRPMKQIQEWIAKTCAAINTSGKYKAAPVVISGLVHQKDSETECGPYSLYYIWNRVNGVPHSKFSEKRIKDSLMIEFRKHLFQ
jgi:hypothetical protein